MRKLLLVLSLCSIASAQSFPSSVYVPLVVKDNVSTTLSAPMAVIDTVAVVTSGTGWAANMLAYICDSSTSTQTCTGTFEIMKVTGVSGNVLTVTRAQGSTSAVTHAAGKFISNAPVSLYTNSAQTELNAIETALGANLTLVPTVQTFDASRYNFTPQSPAGSLAAGSNTITLTPVPQGVNGTDINHYLWIGTTGTPEACLINGGAGTAGQTTGQITISCLNTHTAGYTVASKDGGIQEAIQAAKTAGGGVVFVPASTVTVRAAVQLPSNVTLSGAGQAVSILQVPTSGLAANVTWQVPGVSGDYCIICLASGSSFERIKDLTIDANGVNQTWFYYGDITGFNASNVVIERVTVKNHPIAGGTGVMFQFLGHSPLTSNANNTIINSSSIGIASCTVPNGGGAFYIEGEGNRILSSYAVNFCDSPYVVSLCDHCVVADSVADVGSGQMSTPTYSVEGATYSTFEHDQCIGTGTNGHRFCVGLDSTSTQQTLGITIVGVSSSHASTVLDIGGANGTFGATTQITDTQVIGLHADNSALDCITLSKYVNKLTITGGNLEACGGNGISITSTGAIAAGTVVQNVIINGLNIDHATGSGILAVNSTTGPPVNAIVIVNSFLGDTSASPVQAHGIWFQAGLVSNAYIAGNIITGNTGLGLLLQNTFDVTSIITNNAGAVPATFLAAGLGSAATAGAGSQRYCSDCTTAATCVTSGTGHMATSNGSAWTCQ